MASADTDASRKAFIITHMNNDHARSLSLYLRAFCGLSERASQSPKLEDLRLTDLVISAQGSRYTIPFDPPLQSYAETRARVVAMHKDALEKLDLSDFKLTKYSPPKGGEWIGFTLCLVVLVGYARRGNFEPGSLVYDTLGLDKYPGFVSWSCKWQPWLWGVLAAAHGFEAVVLLGYMRLRKYGVKAFSGLWWTWMVLGFVEGFPAWKRVDGMVRKAEEETKAKSG
ncbi:DUF2470 domain-containing protein [Aspergillus mulundensis]|uniref:DUF2470 domain-containing protein n=1 Tax=Aspergillus mulundensis TaxID=1810919 RepID=A0A3D8R9Q5_9EURO|nr:hypothetical protein DSM5745_08105 [Aspergillus mulundensis]RDW70594.1 hypothetical protein DSM5745_08105 [Aspergillus mulundensis]